MNATQKKAAPVIEKMNSFNAQIAALIIEKKALGMKHAQRPAKKAIDAEIQRIKDVDIKPLAAELAAIRFNCPTRAEFINYIDELSKNGAWAFISLDPYTNDYGEIARHTINVNFDYGKEKEKDHDKLMKFNTKWYTFLKEMVRKYPTFTIKNFADALYAIIYPKERQQDNVYKSLGKGIKYHIYTGKLYVTGLHRSKAVMIDGTYPTKNSRPETICKRLIEKELGLLASKYKIFNFDFVNSFKFDGITLMIEPI